VSRRVARPYAAALFQVLEKEGVAVLRQVEGELATVAGMFARAQDLLKVFEVPTVPVARKRELLQELGERLELRVHTRRLLAALMQHYRLRFLPDVVEAYRELVDKKEGMVRGRVTVPAPPREAQLDALAEALQGIMESRVELESEVKPEMLAGFVVRLGSRVYDGSLRTQLERFAHTAARR
jgi:F-type H+-transporting ATPase subunit delta